MRLHRPANRLAPKRKPELSHTEALSQPIRCFLPICQRSERTDAHTVIQYTAKSSSLKVRCFGAKLYIRVLRDGEYRSRVRTFTSLPVLVRLESRTYLSRAYVSLSRLTCFSNCQNLETHHSRSSVARSVILSFSGRPSGVAGFQANDARQYADDHGQSLGVEVNPALHGFFSM